MQGQTQAARIELSKHVVRIVMKPTFQGDSRHYVAEGEWDLLGNTRATPGGVPRNLEVVAGVGFEPPTSGL